MTIGIVLLTLGAIGFGFSKAGLAGAATGLAFAIALIGALLTVVTRGALSVDPDADPATMKAQRVGGILTALGTLAGVLVGGWRWGWAYGLLGAVLGAAAATGVFLFYARRSTP